MTLTSKSIAAATAGLSPALRRRYEQLNPMRALPAQATPAKAGVTLSIPMRTVSEANRRDHWAVKAARVKAQRATVAIYLSRVPRVRMPVSVRLVRTGGKRLDDDNLRSAMKAARDSIAEAYGVDDGSPLWTWNYDQECGRGPLGVRIEIKPTKQGVSQ